MSTIWTLVTGQCVHVFSLCCAPEQKTEALLTLLSSKALECGGNEYSRRHRLVVGRQRVLEAAPDVVPLPRGYARMLPLRCWRGTPALLHFVANATALKASYPLAAIAAYCSNLRIMRPHFQIVRFHAFSRRPQHTWHDKCT